MNKKVVRNLSLLTLSVVCTTLALKKIKKKNYLKMKNLINEKTKELHVYTCDYIVQNLLMFREFTSLLDKKEGEKSSVYTSRAKSLVFDVYSKNVEIVNTFEKEYKQILKFATELNKVAADAKMVIHVVSDTDADKFANLREESTIQKLGIDVKIDTEFCDIFEEIDDIFEE